MCLRRSLRWIPGLVPAAPSRARDDGCGDVRHRSRGVAARGDEEKEGARAPKHCDPVAPNGQPSAPAPVACRAEGAITSSAGCRSGSHSLRESLSRPGPRAAAPGNLSAAARRASVQDVAKPAQPRSAAPESEVSYSPRQTPRRYGRLPQPGTAPAPQSRSAAASRVDGGGGSMGEWRGVGISLC